MPALTASWVLLGAVYLAASAVSLSVAAVAWQRRRRARAAAGLTTAMLGAAAWAMTDALVLLLKAHGSASATAVVFAVVPACAAVTVVGFLWLSRAVLDPQAHLTPRRRAAVFAYPLVILLVGLADPWIHLLGPAHPTGGPPTDTAPGPGPMFWVNIAITYLVCGWSVLLLGKAWRHAGALQQAQVRSLLLGFLVPFAGNVVTLALLPHDPPELTAVGFALTGLTAAFALFRQDLLTLVPVARGVVLQRLRDAVFVLTADGRIVDLNLTGRALLDQVAPHPSHDVIGRHLAEASGGLLLPTCPSAQSAQDGEYRLESPTGPLVLDQRTDPLTDRHGRPMALVVVIRDVTELHRQRGELADANARLRQQLATIEQLRADLAELAIRDELTGLHNRRHLVRALEAELAAAHRDGHPLSLLMLDVDHFKSVNDRYGHPVGDALLTAIAHVLGDTIEPAEILARFGGEEFVVLLPGLDRPRALERAERLRERCASVQVPGPDGAVSRTVSIGLATVDSRPARLPRPRPGAATGTATRDTPTTPTALLKAADEALYAAKNAGRDRVALVQA